MIFLNQNRQESLFYAENIRESIENLKIEHLFNKPNRYITASIGLAVFRADEISISSEDDIYKMADEALYKAKEGGRNRVYMF